MQMTLKETLLPFFLTKGINGYMKEGAKNKLNIELINLNFERSKKLNYVIFVISLILLCIDNIYKQNGLWVSLPGYKYLFYTHVLLLIVTLTLLLILYINKNFNDHIHMKSIFVMFFTIFVTLNCTVTSIIDQLIHGEITVYIIGTFTIAVMNTLKPATSITINLSNYIIFITGITLIQKNPTILRGHYANGTILVLIAWFLSFILYNTKVKDFISRKTIEYQKCELEKANQQLTTTNHKLERSLSALDESQNIIFTLALALESKDPYSHGHSERVVEFALELAKFLNLSELDQLNIYRAAVLHDIGKIGIPDAILNKQSSLSNEEWLIMKSHPERGEAICSKLNFAKEILPIIRHHHERYDGKGYPDGLSGESIPFLARIVSIADTVDAITSSRPYRSAGMFEQALEELEKNAGTQFDPVLVSAFISLYGNKNFYLTHRFSVC
jgi:putative nucleotidyltransferase with HDIG domain